MNIKARFKRLMNKRISIEFSIRKNIDALIIRHCDGEKYIMIPTRQFNRMKGL